MDSVVGALIFILGACVGSFLNVLVLRFGYSERGGERSACMACGTALGAFDLVPMFSYAALGGHCRTCGSKISIQYPIVEVLTGLLFLLTYLQVSPLGAADELQFILLAGFWAAMVALVAYDMRHTLIPLPFVYGLFSFAALRVVVEVVRHGSGAPVLDALFGAVVSGGFFALIHFATRGRGMGIGDAYVAGAIGLMFGLEAGIVSSVLAVWIGSIVGLTVIGIQYVFQQLKLVGGKTHVTLTTEIPFAPFLALGALLQWSIGINLLALGLSISQL
jgi:leader peptidase (prepilin peptidase)/N-methyltransferase